MSYLIVAVTKQAKLEYRLGNLIIRDEEYRSICIDDISVLIIESTAVSLTAVLVSELIKRKVKLIFCDEKRNPAGEVIPYYGSHDSSGKLRKQIQWDEEIKENVGREIIKEKIRNQAKLLDKHKIDTDVALTELADKVEMYDQTCREAHAAKVYFRALFGNDFNRVSSTPINASLNYGYSILLSMINRKVAASGYLTLLGLYHKNEGNHFNLSSDLIEPWRVLVDDVVKSMNPVKFDKEEKFTLLNSLTREIRIDGKSYRLENALDIYIRSIFNALELKDLKQLKFFEEL